MDKRAVTWRIRLLVFFFAGLVGSLPNARSQQSMAPKPEALGQLYFEDLSLIDRFDTVTIFMTDGPVDLTVARMFERFAHQIGLKNGATQFDARDYDRYAEALAQLPCRPIRYEELPAVFFISKKTRFCEVFRMVDLEGLRQILMVIEKYTACPHSGAKEQVRIEARAAVNTVSLKLHELLRPAGALIDWLVARLPESCDTESH